MRSQVLWRRLTAAAGIYGSALFGVLGTVVAARALGTESFGRLALVLAAVGFLQMFLDLTVEESLVKFGFRYVEREDWGRLRRLFRVALGFKAAGAAVGAVAIAALAVVWEPLFGDAGLLVPLLVGALLPLAQAPETLGSAGLILRGRYDARAWFLALSMALRLAGLGIGSLFGVTEAVAGVVLAQVLATTALVLAGRAALRRFPAAAAARLADERASIRSFVARSSVGTALVSMRTNLGTVLLGIVTAPLQAGYFRVAQAPQAGFATLSAPARLILLTEQTQNVERGRIADVYRQLGRYMSRTAALMVVAVPLFWWLMPDLVRIVFGAKWLPATDAARLVLVAAALQLVFGWTKSFPVSIGRPGLRIVAQAVEIAVLVPALLVLGERWGATGAGAATVVATVAFVVVWAFLLLRLRREPVAAPVAAPADCATS